MAPSARVLLVLLAAAAGTASAQSGVRRATNLAALLTYPGFYHARPILVAGTVELRGTELRVFDDARSIRVIMGSDARTPLRPGPTPSGGRAEVRGEFWDLGQMNADDPRLTAYELRSTFGIDPEGAWPRPGEVTAILATAVTPASAPLNPTIRAIVLNPARYVGQQVTVTGQFSGRNLLGDLPDAPGRSRFDFVLRSADAAIWVSNTPPRGRDEQGKQFELGLDARIDTARWLEVRGTLQQARGLLWIDAEAGTLKAVGPLADTALDEPPIRVPAAPAPEVLFSAPTQDETDVSMSATVRIQFSRDIDPATLTNRVRVSYLTSQSVEKGEPATPVAEFTTDYSAPNRVLELRFTNPLERFRTVKVDLLDGILGADGQSLAPWTLTFAVGGS
jgi:hypothetical protein